MQRLVIIALAGLLAIGCGGDDDSGADSSRPPGTSAPSTPSTTTRTVESEVEAAYLAYWEMGERLLQDPDPDDPEIGSRTTGRVQAAMVDSLTTLRAQGRMVRYGERYRHQVVSVTLTSDGAEVLDCLVDDGEVVDSRTRERISGAVVTVLYRTTMVEEGGAWKASEAIQERTWEGASRCDR